MTIEKSTITPGWYSAKARVGLNIVMGCGRTHFDALKRALDKINPDKKSSFFDNHTQHTGDNYPPGFDVRLLD